MRALRTLTEVPGTIERVTNLAVAVANGPVEIIPRTSGK